MTNNDVTPEEVERMLAMPAHVLPYRTAAANPSGIGFGGGTIPSAGWIRRQSEPEGDLATRLAAAEAVIADALASARQGDYSFRTIRILSAYRPVAAHPEVTS